ncbi:MAG: hypothetical protein E7K59_16245 [Clostridium perfringens]|nr:hypothetical protein [Clostridium perfringens]
MAAKLDKNLKELAQDLLKLQGVEYIDWLNKKHQEVITKNTKIIRNCVKNEIKNSNKKDEVIEEINQESNENLESFEDENYNEDEVESDVFSRDRRYIYLNNEFIRDMLTKREYDTAENKLHMWRELKWLIADDEKLVKRVRIDDERVYAIVIDYSIFSWLKIQMEV